MPLTGFQRAILAELAKAPTDDRYLAGGAAMHFSPHSARYSDDLDFAGQDIVPHYGGPGGVVPRIADARVE